MMILAIIQARLGSERFPRKVLQKLQGKTILEHIVDFLQYSNLINKTVVATTNLAEDDELIEYLKKKKIHYFRGNSFNVLERYYKCSKFFNGDIIVRITADNPLLDPFIIDDAINISLKTRCDYVTNLLHRTFPIGYSIEILTSSLLEQLYQKMNSNLDKEHVTYSLRQKPERYNIKEIFTPKGLERPSWRLTVDYKEDYQLMEKIFSKLYTVNDFIKYNSVVELLDNNPELLEINQKYQNC